jgi:hypothetical protein
MKTKCILTKQLNSRFHELYNNKKYSDFLFKIAETEEIIYSHKNIISCYTNGNIFF